MHPYRIPPSLPSARPAPAAASACGPRVDDLISALLFAVGSLVGIAGMLAADGTLIAVGMVLTVTALLRANAAARDMNETHPEGEGREREQAMDAVYIGLTVFLVTATLGLIRLCERV